MHDGAYLFNRILLQAQDDPPHIKKKKCWEKAPEWFEVIICAIWTKYAFHLCTYIHTVVCLSPHLQDRVQAASPGSPPFNTRAVGCTASPSLALPTISTKRGSPLWDAEEPEVAEYVVKQLPNVSTYVRTQVARPANR